MLPDDVIVERVLLLMQQMTAPWWGKNKDAPPIAMLVADDRVEELIPPEFSEEMKNIFSNLIRARVAASPSIHTVIFMSEAWAAGGYDPNDPASWKVQPSDRPDKKEIFLVTIERRSGFKELRAYPIKRGNNRKYIDEKDFELINGTQGRMMDWFEQPTRH
jgi:hypothetical protein